MDLTLNMSRIRNLLVTIISVVTFLPQGTFAKNATEPTAPTAPPTPEPTHYPSPDPTFTTPYPHNDTQTTRDTITNTTYNMWNATNSTNATDTSTTDTSTSESWMEIKDYNLLYAEHVAENGNVQALGGVAAVSTVSMNIALVLIAVAVVGYFVYNLVRKTQKKKSAKYTWPATEDTVSLPVDEADE